MHYSQLWNVLQTFKEYGLHNHVVHAIEDMPNMTITMRERLKEKSDTYEIAILPDGDSANERAI